MNVGELPGFLNLETLQGSFEDRILSGAYTSDLLSDVMAHGHDADVLVTIQSHKNTVAVATLIGAAAILICNGRPIPEEMIAAAGEEEIAIFRSQEDQFTLSGKIYEILRHG